MRTCFNRDRAMSDPALSEACRWRERRPRGKTRRGGRASLRHGGALAKNVRLAAPGVLLRSLCAARLVCVSDVAMILNGPSQTTIRAVGAGGGGAILIRRGPDRDVAARRCGSFCIVPGQSIPSPAASQSFFSAPQAAWPGDVGSVSARCGENWKPSRASRPGRPLPSPATKKVFVLRPPSNRKI